MEVSMLINVLNQVNEQTRELEAQLNRPFSSEACKSLASQTQATLATAISIAKLLNQPPKSSESPLLSSESPHSENSQKTFKKRKTMPTWNKQVHVCSVSSSMDDGHSWRKYGQKEILGSKFPRGYYRCTHRDTYGCLATKQVQRSDEDSSLFKITLRGDHTCKTRDRQRIPAPPPEENLTLPETESLLQPSSYFSFPSICGPSDEVCGPILGGSASEMVEMLAEANWRTSESTMVSLDFELKEFDFVNEFLLDFSY